MSARHRSVEGRKGTRTGRGTSQTTRPYCQAPRPVPACTLQPPHLPISTFVPTRAASIAEGRREEETHRYRSQALLPDPDRPRTPASTSSPTQPGRRVPSSFTILPSKRESLDGRIEDVWGVYGNSELERRAGGRDFGGVYRISRERLSSESIERLAGWPGNEVSS